MYSYAIYVLHDPLAHVLAHYGIIRPPSEGIAAAIGYCAVMVPLTVAVGAASWHCFEGPILRLKARFSYQPAPATHARQTS